jgi:hypothetical protein
MPRRRARTVEDGFEVKRFRDDPPPQFRCRSRAHASLRNRRQRPFHHGIRGRGGTIYAAAFTVEERQVQADMRTHLIHRPARDIIPPLGGNSSFLLLDLIPHGFHAAAAACSRVHRNSVPSTHMRCMITANRRARATIAFFIPRRLAICIAQALSQHHFFERSML